jgi:DNA-binding response OmpR family regulator
MTEMRDVMIVDDDAHVRIAVRTVLTDAGFTVTMADSGSSCVEKIKNGFRGLILLDIMMPSMDGWDTIDKILEEDLFHGIVITMLTAKDTPDNRMIGLQEWVLDYMTKPFEPEELIQKCTYYLSFITNETDQ